MRSASFTSRLHGEWARIGSPSHTDFHGLHISLLTAQDSSVCNLASISTGDNAHDITQQLPQHQAALWAAPPCLAPAAGLPVMLPAGGSHTSVVNDSNHQLKPSAAAEHWLQVPGCGADLSTRYCQLKRVCKAHMNANSIQRDDSDKLWRFCQQCGKLEPTTAFDGGKRSCRRQLAKRREACRQQQADTGTQSQRPKQPRPSSFALFETPPPLAASHTPSAPLPALQAPAQVAPMMQQQQQWAIAGAAGPAAAVNSLLNQQLQTYSERCAMLCMQIDLLEAEACKHELLDTDAAAPAGDPSSAAAQHRTSPPADAGAVTYTPVFRPTTGESCWGSGFVSPTGGTIPAENGSCTSTGYGASNTAPLPGAFADTSRSSSTVHHGLFSAGASLTGPSNPGLAFADCLQQQQQASAAGAAAAAGGLGAFKLEPWSCIHSEPVNACGFLSADCHKLHAFSSGGWACAQQQMMQPPMHVEQMLAGGASAPLPAWGASTGLPAAAAPCGPQSGFVLPVFIDRRAAPAVGGVSAGACGHSQPLMVLTEDDDTGVDIMDCDSVEDIQGAQEMSRPLFADTAAHCMPVACATQRLARQVPASLPGPCFSCRSLLPWTVLGPGSCFPGYCMPAAYATLSAWL